MANCYWCKAPLEFIRKKGSRWSIPIHPKGWPACPRGPVSLPLPLFPTLFVEAFATPVEIMNCTCGHCVTQVKHNIGQEKKIRSVGFEIRQSGWQRHACDHTPATDYGLDFLLRQAGQRKGLETGLALVAGAKKLWGPRPSILVALVEFAPVRLHRCLEIRIEKDLSDQKSDQPTIFPGSIVALEKSNEVRSVVNLSGNRFDCVDAHCSPQQLDIPAEWLLSAQSNFGRS